MIEFRFMLKDRDGSIIMNRLKNNREIFYDDKNNLDKEFLELILNQDCREHGVILISYKEVKNGIEGLVKFKKEK